LVKESSCLRVEQLPVAAFLSKTGRHGKGLRPVRGKHEVTSRMISTPERRHVENARIPCAIPVELTPDSRGPRFEADAVDLSPGGLSLRASSLPEVGAMLNCRFETLPGGTRISGRGEVVWAKLSGERSGEFGLRFTEIEPEAQALLAEMIAERVASGGSPAPQNPRTATLEIEHAEQPITAKLTRAVGQDVVFEQPLDVLALGSSVVARADKALGQGNILRVDLRMDGGTPTLALTVRFSQPQGETEQFGEYDWGEPESGMQLKSLEGDTRPDLAAPSGVEEQTRGQLMAAGGMSMPELAAALSPHTTTIGYPQPIAGPHGRTVAGYAVRVPAAVAEDEGDEDVGEDEDVHAHDHAQAHVFDEERGPWGDKDTEPDVLADLPRSPPEQLGLVHVAPRPVPRPAPVLVRKPEDFPNARSFVSRDDVASVEEYEAVGIADSAADSAPGTYAALELSTSSGEQRAPEGAGLWADSDPEDDWSELQPEAAWSPASSGAGWPSQSRASVPDATHNSALVRFLRIFAGLWEALQPALVAARRTYFKAQHVVLPSLHKRLVGSPMVKSTLRGVGQRPRRSVGLPTVEQIPKWTRGMGRLVLLAALMLGCGMLLVYAMAPAAPTDEIVSHRPLQLPDGEHTAENAASDPALVGTTPEAATESSGSQPRAAESGRTQMAGPNARPKQPPPAPQPEAAAISFGAKQVPNAQHFLLRMSDPVKTLHGKADAHGFIVEVPASRAIDRAAPIAAANKSVTKATILNKGTHAELNIRFAEGKNPAYRVSAQQAGLEVLISP
jgi:hypothetical protein